MKLKLLTVIASEKIQNPKQCGWKKYPDPEHLNWYTGKCYSNKLNFRANIEDLMQRFNQSDGVHIFQRMNGCVWDDETEDFSGFVQFGYDGEDFITFDMKTLTWVAPTPRAVITKHEWDRNTYRNLFWKNALTEDCIPYLKKYVKYGKSTLQEAAFPSVSLLQKSPSSPVTCHATGFYPERADLVWRKDGIELHEGVYHGEILPNHDGTFQLSVDVYLSSVTPEDWQGYDCVFQYPSAEDIYTRLDKAVIRTNYVPESSPLNSAAIVAIVVLLFLAVLVGFFIWRRNRENGGNSESGAHNLDATREFFSGMNS